MFIDTIKTEFNSSCYAVNFLPVRKTYWNVLSFKCLELIQWKKEQRPVAGMGRGRLLDGEAAGTFLAVYGKMFYASQSVRVSSVRTHARIKQLWQ